MNCIYLTGFQLQYNKREKKIIKNEVWELSFDWKECRGEEFSNQKLNYMHDNPCTGKWNLCNAPVDYIHSSAKFYITNEQGVYPVTNIAEMQDVQFQR